MQNKDSVPKFQILSLSGGGFRGLYTAQILANLEEHSKQPIASHFDLLAGTSIGGILALAAACEIPMTKIVDLFTEHGHQIFKKRPWLETFGGLRKSPYSCDGLRQLLSQDDLFGQRILADVLHPIIVPAINYSTGKPVMFKTPHHHTLKNDWRYKLVDLALATSAAPSYFPRHMMNNNQYVDGGLFANNPVLQAIHEADYYFGQNPKNIRLLGVGTMSSLPNADPRASANGGILDWAESWNVTKMPKNIINLTLSAQEQNMRQMAGHRITNAGGTFIYLDDLLTESATHVVGLDKVSPEAISTLLGHANETTKYALGESAMTQILSTQAPPPAWFNGPYANTSMPESTLSI